MFPCYHVVDIRVDISLGLKGGDVVCGLQGILVGTAPEILIRGRNGKLDGLQEIALRFGEGTVVEVDRHHLINRQVAIGSSLRQLVARPQFRGGRHDGGEIQHELCSSRMYKRVSAVRHTSPILSIVDVKLWAQPVVVMLVLSENAG
eukprot:4430308-Pleurochrysis_carterae.AAC.1